MLEIPLVLVTENRTVYDYSDQAARYLDQTSEPVAESIATFFRQIFRTVEIVSDLQLLHGMAERRNSHLFLSHWNGENSRNRTGFGTSICELNGFVTMGADTLSRLSTNDKRLAKSFLELAHLDHPNCVHLPSKHQLIGDLNALSDRVIVKPNSEGTSMGITDANIFDDHEKALEFARGLLEQFPDGVIIEEFIVGPEVSISFLKTRDGKIYCAGGERYLVHSPEALQTSVYTSQQKMDPEIKVGTRPIKVPAHIMRKAGMLFESIGHTDYIRLDTRLADGKFHVIEITVDPLMLPDAAFIDNFRQSGINPINIFRELAEHRIYTSGLSKPNAIPMR